MKRADIIELRPCSNYTDEMLADICPDPERDYTIRTVIQNARRAWRKIYSDDFPDVDLRWILSSVLPPFFSEGYNSHKLHACNVPVLQMSHILQQHGGRRKIRAHPFATYSDSPNGAAATAFRKAHPELEPKHN